MEGQAMAGIAPAIKATNGAARSFGVLLSPALLLCLRSIFVTGRAIRRARTGGC
jgi:hypothetical protein